MRSIVLVLVLIVLPRLAVAEEIELSQALDELETSNEDWEILAERIVQAQTLRREARARLLPQLNAGASVSYNGEEVAIGDRIVRREVDWAVTGSASVTVFDGTAYPLLAQAGHNVRVIELDAEWQRRTLQFEVQRAYFELAAAQRDLELAERTVGLRQAYVDRATALEASGVALQLDVARAMVQKLEAEQFVLESRTRVRVSANTLAVLLGRDPDSSLRATEPGMSPAPPTQASTQLTERADLEAGLRMIDAEESLKTSRWWSLAPRFDLRGDGRYGPPSFTTPDGVTWSITFAATWLLYDGGARYARIRAAESRVREAELRQTQRERFAKAGVVDSLQRWQTAFEGITVAQQQTEVARQAYEMTVARFESGLATSIEVTEAADQMFRAESALSAARLNADVAAASYSYLSEIP